MYKRRYSAFSALLLALLMLAGCQSGGSGIGSVSTTSAISSAEVQSAYEEGYAAGLAEGQAQVPPAPADPYPEREDFVLLSEVVPDAILEVRYHSTYNFVGERIDGYEEPVAILTKEAAAALKEVSDQLKERGYRLKIYDAYRPQRAVDHFKGWAEALDDTRMKEYFYPDVEKSVLFQKGYISAKSGHSRGSTVDLTLFDMRTGKEVDMGGTFDYFGPESHAAYTETLTKEQIRNRQILRDAMLNHGFKGIKTEWWHFTLKNEPFPETYFDFPVEGW